MSHLLKIEDELFKLKHNYQNAAKLTSVESLKKFLGNLAKEKSTCRDEILVSCSETGGNEYSVPAAFRETAMKTETILVRCMNEEERLIRLYQQSLSRDYLNKDERTIVYKQLNEALVTYNQLRVIKQSRNYQ